MSEQRAVDIPVVELVKVVSNTLQQCLLRPPKDKVKPLFKDLKAGKSITLGKLEAGELLSLTLVLQLDYSEFVGPGFNVDVFRATVQAMLNTASMYLKSQRELNILTSESGSTLVHTPGAITLNDQTNVLVMAFEPIEQQQLTVKLMFVDPQQYEQFKR